MRSQLNAIKVDDQQTIKVYSQKDINAQTKNKDTRTTFENYSS